MRHILLAMTLATFAVATAAAQEPATEQAPPDTALLAQMAPEELFLRASSSALQFADMIAPSRRALISEHERTLPYLITRLDTDDPRERIALEDVLFKIGDPAVPPLIEAMGIELEREDTSRGARLASSILGRLGDVRALPALESAAEHGDWKVRSTAVAALGRIGSETSEQVIASKLGDPNEVVRTAACVALKRLASTDNGLSGETMDLLAARLGDSSYAVRYSAADALASCGSSAEEKLEGLASGGDVRGTAPGKEERIAALAARALGDVGTRDARQALRSLAESPSWLVRGYAALGLGGAEVGRKDLGTLSRLADDAHPFVRACAATALEKSENN